MYHLKILHQLKQKHSDLDIRLILIGDGKLRKDFQDLVDKYNLKRQVVFTGMLDKVELNKYYSTANVFILNSDNEGCPNVVLEAMSFGLPVISTKVGGTTEMIKDGQSGYLVNSRDHDTIKKSILNLYHDQALQQSMGQQAIDRIQAHFLFAGQMKKFRRVVLADSMNSWVGSWLFLVLHILWFMIWLALQLDINLLTLIVSLEAIILMILLLMSQNKQSYKDNVRDEADLQADLKSAELAEEILKEIKEIKRKIKK